MGVAEAKPKKRRVVKKSSTVREKREQAAVTPSKKRSVSGAAKKAGGPFRAIGHFIAVILKPFSFLLWPFRTRPARFIGRILAKIFFINYIRDSWRELRLVEWPNRITTIKLTAAVFAFALAFGTFVAVTDYILDKIFKQILT